MAWASPEEAIMRALRTSRFHGGTVAAAALLVVLSGCAGAPEPAPPDPARPAAPSGDASGGDTACVIGSWLLDVDDYRAQAEAYLLLLGIPLEAFDLTGTMILDITPVYFSLSAAMVTSAVVHGVPISEPQEFSGGADWAWEADDETTLSLDAWAWGVEPADTGDAPVAPPFIDPGAPASVTCEGDRLSLQGDGAPLVGHFIRR